MMHVVVGRPPVGAKSKVVYPGPIVDLSWERVEIDEMQSLATTQSLMGDLGVYRFTGALAGERGDEFLSLAKELVASPHTFIFEEEKLLKRPTDLLTKAGATITVHPAAEKKESFDVFSVANIFATRDKKKLWLALTAAERAGVVPEAIAGMLHWKVRAMLADGRSPKYTREELKGLSRTLVTLYHDSHRGAGDLSLLLERLALLL